jgi:hypothetical protein
VSAASLLDQVFDTIGFDASLWMPFQNDSYSASLAKERRGNMRYDEAETLRYIVVVKAIATNVSGSQ